MTDTANLTIGTKMFSYHDATVAAHNTIYRMSNLPFVAKLTCDRVAGWELTAHRSGTDVEIIATEYADYPFSMYAMEVVSGVNVYEKAVCFCDSRFILPVPLEKVAKCVQEGYLSRVPVGKDFLDVVVESNESGIVKLGVSGFVGATHERMATYMDLTGTIFYEGLSWSARYVCHEGIMYIHMHTPKTDNCNPMEFEEA